MLSSSQEESRSLPETPQFGGLVFSLLAYLSFFNFPFFSFLSLFWPIEVGETTPKFQIKQKTKYGTQGILQNPTSAQSARTGDPTTKGLRRNRLGGETTQLSPGGLK